MAGLSNWVNGNNWEVIKTKFNDIVSLLNGGTVGQVLGSNGAGNMPAWADVPNPETANGVATQVSDVLKYLLIDIGSWDMDALDNLDITIPDTNIADIVACTVLISQDGGGNKRELTGWDASLGQSMGYFTLTGNLVVRLFRIDGGFFDSLSFNDSVINRGTVILTYRS